MKMNFLTVPTNIGIRQELLRQAIYLIMRKQWDLPRVWIFYMTIPGKQSMRTNRSSRNDKPRFLFFAHLIALWFRAQSRLLLPVSFCFFLRALPEGLYSGTRRRQLRLSLSRRFVRKRSN